jgi:hypothetical protein
MTGLRGCRRLPTKLSSPRALDVGEIAELAHFCEMTETRLMVVYSRLEPV